LGDGVGLTEVSLAVPAKNLWLAGDSSSASKELQLDILLAYGVPLEWMKRQLLESSCANFTKMQRHTWGPLWELTEMEGVRQDAACWLLHVVYLAALSPEVTVHLATPSACRTSVIPKNLRWKAKFESFTKALSKVWSFWGFGQFAHLVKLISFIIWWKLCKALIKIRSLPPASAKM
jgi:hypothetical protein